ncbi:MAG TPA: hypothetical protein DHU63_07740 [Candidatus Marinimicrobia bacterium]|nr:MAG: hypothetical protein COY19_03280 [Candidatus Marinimicrobia bacterium CG_4_10_14_0_2_um_filter_48_9]PJA55086.1 MAG: hypothetical protein CO167_00205 [Candidatus Marinimicrobia bacterium CG_4_9_14_3_um_filter_48_9]HCW76413.1 hypothetical protein [Candidatus Neomarinimicrobiota bacterium]
MSEKKEHRESAPPSHKKMGYDKAEISIKWIAVIGILFVVLMVVISVGTKSLFIKDKNAIIYDQVLKPVSPLLIQIQAREDSLLDNYQILNIDKGIYQIPIDRAMEVLVEKAKRDQHTQP